MVTYHDLRVGFRKLSIDPLKPVIVHASLSAFGEIRGGVSTFLGALLASTPRVLMPAFTFKTMVIPEIGPPLNGMQYGQGRDLNRMAEFFDNSMPVDSLMGDVAESLRLQPETHRSIHPILSFCGIGVNDALASQTLQAPFAPIEHLMNDEGWVILAGVDQSVNTSIHLAEQMAGRMSFTRWALTEFGIVSCPNYPGCSDGFTQLDSKIAGITRTVKVNKAEIKAIPLAALLTKVTEMVHKNPKVLLCSRKNCPRCDAIRMSLKQDKHTLAR